MAGNPDGRRRVPARRVQGGQQERCVLAVAHPVVERLHRIRPVLLRAVQVQVAVASGHRHELTALVLQLYRILYCELDEGEQIVGVILPVPLRIRTVHRLVLVRQRIGETHDGVVDDSESAVAHPALRMTYGALLGITLVLFEHVGEGDAVVDVVPVDETAPLVLVLDLPVHHRATRGDDRSVHE